MAFEVLRTRQVRDAVQKRMTRAERARYEAARDEPCSAAAQAGGRCVLNDPWRRVRADHADVPECSLSDLVEVVHQPSIGGRGVTLWVGARDELPHPDYVHRHSQPTRLLRTSRWSFDCGKRGDDAIGIATKHQARRARWTTIASG